VREEDGNDDDMGVAVVVVADADSGGDECELISGEVGDGGSVDVVVVANGGDEDATGGNSGLSCKVI
jgi:hypothetical protein